MLFILSVKLFELHRKTQKSINVRDALWSLYSNSKSILFSTIIPNISSWNQAREYKITYWADRHDLLTAFDKIARFEFSSDSRKDPGASGLFYLSLRKKQILLSLWRISAGHPEQQKMLKFLSNDFREQRWRKAALKNAFVLLSKHRFADAACFFLLADSLKDAANVILKQMDDLPLAFGVCRVYEGDSGPVLNSILTTSVLPQAVLNNDRWMASLIYHALDEPSLALKALMMSPIDLSDNKKLVSPEEAVNKSFLVEDPALLMLYKQIREKDSIYLSAAHEIETGLEYRTVQRVTAIYIRMGCDYLALSLLMNWHFQHEYATATAKIENSSQSQHGSYLESNGTTKMRSIFDKFDDLTGSVAQSRSASPNSETRMHPKDCLNDYTNYEKGAFSGKDTNINSGDSSAKSSKDSDLKNTPVTAASTPILDQSSAATPTKKDAAGQATKKPRNLLDDFF